MCNTQSTQHWDHFSKYTEGYPDVKGRTYIDMPWVMRCSPEQAAEIRPFFTVTVWSEHLVSVPLCVRGGWDIVFLVKIWGTARYVTWCWYVISLNANWQHTSNKNAAADWKWLNHDEQIIDLHYISKIEVARGKTSLLLFFLLPQVIKQTRAMFPDNVEFFIHGMRESDLVDAINSAASSFLHVIDICIKRFGLENVLY